MMSQQLERFRELVESLVAQVASWAPSEWATKTYPKRMRDDDGLLHEVPALFLQKGPIRVLLDPIAYDVPGAEAVVDLYLMPTYDDLASLYCRDGEWTIHYDFPAPPAHPPGEVAPEALPLSDETIRQVLDSIAEHAVPSF